MLLQNNIVKVRFCWKYSNLTSEELSIQYLLTAIKSFSLKLNLNLFYMVYKWNQLRSVYNVNNLSI